MKGLFAQRFFPFFFNLSLDGRVEMKEKESAHELRGLSRRDARESTSLSLSRLRLPGREQGEKCQEKKVDKKTENGNNLHCDFVE